MICLLFIGFTVSRNTIRLLNNFTQHIADVMMAGGVVVVAVVILVTADYFVYLSVLPYAAYFCSPSYHC